MFGYAAETRDATDPPVRSLALRRSAGARRVHQPAGRGRRGHRLSAAAAARGQLADLGRGDRARRIRRRADGIGANRRARPRRQRAQEARGSDARPLPSAAAGREAGGARSDDLGRRPRAEQPAGDDPHLGRAPVAAARRRNRRRTRRGLETILSESERAAKIVRNLLTFARKRQSTRAMVDLNQVVRETLALRSYEQRITNITIVDALAAGLPQVFADPHQMQQVLLNLIINAEQAMLTANGRGTLVVRSWHDVDREAVVLEDQRRRPGDRRRVAAEDFRSVFHDEGSRQGNRAWPDRRLRDCAGARRPDPRWRPTPGGRVVLRRAARQRHAAAAAGGRAAAERDFESLAGSTVLVVEDEPALAAAVSEALTDAGFVVDRAGRRRGSARRVGAKLYDLIVCDLKMPKVDGMRFYERLSAADPDAGAPRDFRDRRRRRHRGREVPAGKRLPLAGQAVPARRLAPDGAARVLDRKEKPGDIRAGPRVHPRPEAIGDRDDASLPCRALRRAVGPCSPHVRVAAIGLMRRSRPALRRHRRLCALRDAAAPSP